MLFWKRGRSIFHPRVQIETVSSREDIQRLYFTLKGEQSPSSRLIIVGKKQLPSYGESQVEFAFVDAVSSRLKQSVLGLRGQRDETKTRGERTLPPTRLLAEGKDLFLKDESKTHLVYQ